MQSTLKLTSIGILFLVTTHCACAQVGASGYSLPLNLAMEAASEAFRTCEASGYRVSVSVVDSSGVVKLQAKGDQSTIHTKDSSFRKAYTVITMAPIFKYDTNGQFVERLAKNPAAPALASLPNIILLPGAVAVRAHGEVVAAIGVGGAPGGEKDEVCAQAGLTRIADRLPKC